MLCVSPLQPITEGALVSAVTAWARIPCDEQELVPGLLAEAVDYFERNCNRVFDQRSVVQQWDCWPDDHCLELDRWPVSSVSSIELWDQGAWVADDLTNWNLLGIDRCTNPRIRRDSRPTLGRCATVCDAAIKCTYIAGYDPLTSAPPILMRGLREHVSLSYRYRESVVTGTLATVPHSLDRVVANLKRHQIGSDRERCSCLEV